MLNTLPYIYLDNAATTKPDKEVVALSLKINEEFFANPSSTHHLGLKANTELNRYRETILKTLNLKDYKVIFTSSSTEALNLAIKGYALKFKNRGTHLITANNEHPAVLEAFTQLRDVFGFKLDILPVNEEGSINLNDLEEKITNETILVSFMAVNNEVGSYNDLRKIRDIVNKYPKCALLSDTTQLIGKERFDYSLLDMFVVSAHKIHGLKNSGALILKKKISLLPLLSGGGQEEGLRSGTLSLENAATLALALHLSYKTIDKDLAYVQELNKYARERLDELKDELVINSPAHSLPYILNFSVNKKAAVVVEYLSSKNIYISSRSACHSKFEASSYVVFNMFKDEKRANNTLRISFSKDSTKEEIDALIDNLKEGLKGIR